VCISCERRSMRCGGSRKVISSVWTSQPRIHLDVLKVVSPLRTLEVETTGCLGE
jgi:hypothetical protein